MPLREQINIRFLSCLALVGLLSPNAFMTYHEGSFCTCGLLIFVSPIHRKLVLWNGLMEWRCLCMHGVTNTNVLKRHFKYDNSESSKLSIENHRFPPNTSISFVKLI